MLKRYTFAVILLWMAFTSLAQSAFPPMTYSKAVHKEPAKKAAPERVTGTVRLEHLPNLNSVTLDYNGYFFRYTVVSIARQQDRWVIKTDSSIKLEVSASEVLVYRTKSAYSRFYN